jgi:hypothetical protein
VKGKRVGTSGRGDDSEGEKWKETYQKLEKEASKLLEEKNLLSLDLHMSCVTVTRQETLIKDLVCFHFF